MHCCSLSWWLPLWSLLYSPAASFQSYLSQLQVLLNYFPCTVSILSVQCGISSCVSVHVPLAQPYIPLLTVVQWGVVFTWLTSPHPPHYPTLIWAPLRSIQQANRCYSDECNQPKAVRTHSLGEWRMGKGVGWPWNSFSSHTARPQSLSDTQALPQINLTQCTAHFGSRGSDTSTDECVKMWCEMNTERYCLQMHTKMLQCDKWVNTKTYFTQPIRTLTSITVFTVTVINAVLSIGKNISDSPSGNLMLHTLIHTHAVGLS